ncbi:Hypothetical predicted protein [Lecanosticta acicola]|uniref:Uncharacterized protein n=1 Tax=Lecanosticta acicola TaxID=111012 RepID=A0AAI8YS87_9PEZI|nr:Hypothetical predicted protein [Lecanosticta acicola]
MEYRNPYAEPASTASSITRAHRGDGFSDVSMTDADPPPSRPPPVASTASSHEYPRAPPPAAHRRTASSIGTNSYMDYDPDDIPSPPVHSSISGRTPRQYSYQEQPFQSAPRRPQQAALEEHYRQYQDPRTLLPTEVRPPVSFAYELEPAGYAVSHQQYYGTPEHRLERRHQEESHLQAVPETARQITHSEVDMAFSRPYQWQDEYRPRASPPPPGVDPQLDWQSKELYGRPFVYEQDLGIGIDG